MKYLSKTIEYGLYLLVFLLPIQTRWIIRQGMLNNGPWEYGTYSLYATDILLIILLALFIALSLLKFGNFKFQILNLLIFGLILVSAVSIFSAVNKSLALYKFGWLMLGIGLFWLVTRVSYNRLKLIWFFLAGIAIQALLAIGQFLSQSTFENKWLGLALHKSSELGTSVIETIGRDGIGERWLRAYGGLDHPNILGGLLAIGILFLIGEIIGLEKFNKLPNPNPQKIKNVVCWLLLILFTAALFFSFSRGAWLGWGIGLGLIAVWSIFRKDLIVQKSIAQILLISGVVILILFFAYPNLVNTRLYESGRLEVKSTSERIESLKNSWGIIKNNWVGGTGIGNYALAGYRMKMRECEVTKSGTELSTGKCENLSSYTFQPVHDVFLLVLSETGIVGLLFFLCLIVYLLITNYQLLITNKISDVKYQMSNLELEIGDKNNSKDWIISLSVLVAMIMIMSLDHWLWSLHFGVLLLWLILGLISRQSLVRAG